MSRIVTPVAVAAALAVSALHARADAVPVIGGPTYDAATQTGYQAYQYTLYLKAGVPSGDGFGLASPQLTVNGQSRGARPFYFDANGANAFASFGSTGLVVGRDVAGEAFGSLEKVNGNTSLGDRAVRWNANGSITELQHTGVTDFTGGSSVTAVNAGGTAVGQTFQDTTALGAYVGVYAASAMRWEAGGTAVTPLGTLGAVYNVTTAGVVNTAGIAAGMAQRVVNNEIIDSRPVRWDADSTAATPLATLGVSNAGTTNGNVYAINDNGIVVGACSVYVNGEAVSGAATRWAVDGSVTALDSFVPTGGLPYGVAYDINDAGTTVGMSRKFGPGSGGLNVRAARWDAGGTAVTELGTVGVGGSNVSSWAHDINANGIAVGAQQVGTNGVRTAVLWGIDGVAVDLNTLIDPTLGWTLMQADTITDAGWISGYGRFDPDGTGAQIAYGRNFLIQVPEPTAIGAILLAGIAITRRTRRVN